MKTITQTVLALSGALAISIAVCAQGTNNNMLANGVSFLGVPYVANTLEQDGKEQLVMNRNEVDCTTFVEYVLALSLLPLQDGKVSEKELAQQLLGIRYRNGKIDGYTSRLHYITDWVGNGVRNGLIVDVTAAHSPYKISPKISYMSTHPHLYKHLAHSPENVAKMKEIEQALSKEEVHYLPARKLPDGGLAWIKSGDIIAITTGIAGLDVAHIGIAFYAKGQLKLLHASSTEKKVVVSSTPLAQMLKNNQRWTGIRVLRMKE